MFQSERLLVAISSLAQATRTSSLNSVMQQAGLFVYLRFIVWALGLTTACGERTDGVTRYEASGVLKEFDASHHQATIAHEEIPDYMPAMTMSFDVSDPAELEGLKPGARLAFQLCLTGDRAWIERIKQTAPVSELPFAPAESDAKLELNMGDPLPDIVLVNQSNELIHLRDFRGRVLALTFIYTGCPLPTYCLLMNRHFQSAQSLLARLGLSESCHFLSVTLDTKHDTPAVLAAYATAHQADLRRWTFVTAEEKALHQLGDAIGLEFRLTDGSINHNLRTVVLDRSGRIRHIFRGNTWTPQELAAEIRSALAVPP